jgi:hypothetical protein
MKPVTPEFAARRGPALALWWVAAALLLAAAAAWLVAWRHHEGGRLLAAEVAAARAAATRPPPVAAPPPPPAYAESARDYLAERTPDWQATLLALERNAMLGVTPVLVEVQPRERAARVEVEFGDYAVLMRYLDQLNAGGDRAEWALVSAQQQAGPGGSTAVLLRRW